MAKEMLLKVFFSVRDTAMLIDLQDIGHNHFSKELKSCDDTY